MVSLLVSAGADRRNTSPFQRSAYRHMFGLEAERDDLEPLEQRLAAKPPIAVSSVSLDGVNNPLKPGGTAAHADPFTGRHEHRQVKAGHNLLQEASHAFADAALTVRDWMARV